MSDQPMSHTRRHCREWCVQLLFQLDFHQPDTLDEIFEHFWAEIPQANTASREYAQGLTLGVREHREVIDALIARVAPQWDISRMGGIDRNVIRLATYEMMHREDVPATVSINEAVDIAKYFSNEESGKFVNGVLDRIRKECASTAKSSPRTPG